MIPGHGRVERIVLEGSGAAHPRRDDVLAVGVEPGQAGRVAPARGRVHVRRLEALVVVLDNGIEEAGEHGVGLGIAGVGADAGVRVLQA